MADQKDAHPDRPKSTLGFGGIDFAGATGLAGSASVLTTALKGFSSIEPETWRAFKAIQGDPPRIAMSSLLQGVGPIAAATARGIDSSAPRSTLALVHEYLATNPAPTLGAVAQASLQLAQPVPAVSQRLTGYFAFKELGPVFARYAAPDTTAVRLSALKLGYAQRLGGPADAFGRLDAAVRSSPALADAVDNLMTTTRSRGGLGFNQRGVEEALDRVDDVLADPEVERVVAEPLEEVEELAGTHEDVILLPDILGAARRAREFRLSTRGIFCAFTTGGVHWVTNVATGTPMPVATVEAVVIGVDVYEQTRSRTKGSE